MKFGPVVFVFAHLILYTNCTQHLYKIVPDHCLIKNSNRELIRYCNSKCIKTSRTQLYLNSTFSLNVDILSDNVGQIKITGYQFRSNEYRKGPIDFMLGMCSAFQSQLYDIPNILSNSNLRCPLKKGNAYYVHNMSPNASNMPPLIPEGKWMIEVTFLYMMKYELFAIEWYTAVEYPLLP